MKTLGFSFIDSYALKVQGEFIDLHNDCEFEGYFIDVAQGQLTLFWRRLDQQEVSSAPRTFRFLVNGVRRIRVSPPRRDGELGAGRTVSFVGFLHVDQEEIMDGCVDYGEAGEGPDFIIGFEDESTPKVFGRSGTIEVEQGRK